MRFHIINQHLLSNLVHNKPSYFYCVGVTFHKRLMELPTTSYGNYQECLIKYAVHNYITRLCARV